MRGSFQSGNTHKRWMGGCAKSDASRLDGAPTVNRGRVACAGAFPGLPGAGLLRRCRGRSSFHAVIVSHNVMLYCTMCAGPPVLPTLRAAGPAVPLSIPRGFRKKNSSGALTFSAVPGPYFRMICRFRVASGPGPDFRIMFARVYYSVHIAIGSIYCIYEKGYGVTIYRKDISLRKNSHIIIYIYG